MILRIDEIAKHGHLLNRSQPVQRRHALVDFLFPRLAADPLGVQALLGQAKAGDLASIRELLDRTIGKPAQSELLERVEALEQSFNERDKP